VIYWARLTYTELTEKANKIIAENFGNVGFHWTGAKLRKTASYKPWFAEEKR